MSQKILDGWPDVHIAIEEIAGFLRVQAAGAGRGGRGLLLNAASTQVALMGATLKGLDVADAAAPAVGENSTDLCGDRK